MLSSSKPETVDGVHVEL
jgi:hypothetical protein